MTMARSSAPPVVSLPLFRWSAARSTEGLRKDRERLKERIARLKRHSHERVALEARLRTLTEQILRTETGLTTGE